MPQSKTFKFKVVKKNNFEVGTILTGKIAQYKDGPRCQVITKNGTPICGFVTEKCSNLRIVH